MPDHEKAIRDAEEMRKTHTDWIEHLDSGPSGIGRCACCPPGIEEVVGDAAYHQETVEQYDNILAVLRALPTEEGSDG